MQYYIGQNKTAAPEQLLITGYSDESCFFDKFLSNQQPRRSRWGGGAMDHHHLLTVLGKN